MRLWPGSPFPLGATYDGSGTNFAVFSEVAERVELCLFDSDGSETRLDLPETTAQVWHGYLPTCGPGQRYGYRVHGPYEPSAGLRCHPAKLLLDPYATAVDGEVAWDEALFTYRFDEPDGPVNDLDSGPHMPKGVVTSPYFDWAHDRPPRTPWNETVVYEVHVKGFTERHPGIPEQLRGTYAGLAHPAAIEYLSALGVTAVELLPVHQFIQDSHLVERGLRNYWGYNSIGFLAPHNAYSSSGQSGGQVQEFKQMVKALHAAGIEVILDVVYNHTAEGNHLVNRVKLIAEPWDIGEGGYQVGNFPPLWSEWNGKYRDCIRDFWRGEDQTMGEFASRISGSSDLYEDDGRHPNASINFVTAHDGFTLADLTAYNEKHNDANGEGGADGESHNSSWNCGAEGPTDDPEVNDLRGRQRRNFITTLLLSQGIPMLLGGDEMGRTQGGNNNAYCQDNEVSWFDWEHLDGELLVFTQRVIALRKAHPVFRRRRFSTAREMGWFRPDGQRMTDEDWESGFAKSVAVSLDGEAITETDARGERITGDSFLVVFNAHFEPLEFCMPDIGERWLRVLDTADTFNEGDRPAAGEAANIESRSIAVFRRAA
jgi:pullulanase/glycogen debranching enzyme